MGVSGRSISSQSSLLSPIFSQTDGGSCSSDVRAQRKVARARIAKQLARNYVEHRALGHTLLVSEAHGYKVEFQRVASRYSEAIKPEDASTGV